ncbi:MAG: gamma-glutamyl-gamma-aminobutyrate hydrolase family protein [bacterium]|nr:gamma-glutamyl-gamma-aminobutyrate hydrolase family protein [bacterium]
MKPVIGVTCVHDWKEERNRQNNTYIQAVLKAGGVPILLPCLESREDIEQHLDRIDALLVCGGPDMDPSYFGEEPHPKLGSISPMMDVYENCIIKLALHRNMPILGICRGVQVVNIVAGGTLMQDIATSAPCETLKHQQEAPRSSKSHSVEVRANTKFAKIFPASNMRVNSFHHQAVNVVAPGFVVSAVAPDGIIEAIESTRHSFVIGVQWHPECMWDQSENYDGLFEAFIESAITYGTK